MLARYRRKSRPPLITRVRGIQPTIDRITDDRFAGMREFPRTGK